MTALFQLKSNDDIEWMECAALGGLAWLLHGFSTRRAQGGDFSLGHASALTSADIDQNRRRFYRAIGAEQFCIALLRQIHSTTIYHVGRQRESNVIGMTRIADAFESPAPARYPGGRGLPQPTDADPVLEGDALMTAESGVLVTIRTADCLPILIADPEARAIAAVHAGWRGALERIVAKTVVAMKERFDARPENLRVAMGPSIRSCCYEVGDELVRGFSEQYANAAEFFVSPTENGLVERASVDQKRSGANGSRAHLDLVGVAKRQLAEAGVLLANVHVAPYCTACQTDQFFSHRKEGARAGRMMAVIGIRQ